MFTVMLRSITRCSQCGQFGHNRRTCGSSGGTSLLLPTLSGRISSRVLRLQEKQREAEEAERVVLTTMNDEMLHLLRLVIHEIRVRFPVVTEADVFLKEIHSQVKVHATKMRGVRTNSDRQMLLGKLTAYLELYYNRLVQEDGHDDDALVVIPSFKTWTVGTVFRACCDSSLTECPVCYEKVDNKNMVTNQCGHGVCSGCLIDFMKTNQKRGAVPLCVLCRAVVSKIEFCSPVSYNQFVRVFPEKILITENGNLVKTGTL